MSLDHAASSVEPALHRRFVDLNVFDRGERLLVRGRLQDSRPWQDDPERAIVHDMSMELEVRLSDMVIVTAVADMSAFPHAECPLITARFSDLVGVSIARGYTRSLRDVFGGVTGCAHLYELARVAGSAVVQANMSRGARKRPRVSLRPEAVTKALSGMCHVWATDGVGVRKLALGWRPGPDTAYPAPAVAQIMAQSTNPPSEQGREA